MAGQAVGTALTPGTGAATGPRVDPALVVVMLGPPGAGKSTQAARLAAAQGIPVIAPGALLRAEVAGATSLGKDVQGLLATGEHVDDVTVNHLVAARTVQPDCRHGFILDGYPRTLGQARFLDRLLAERGLPPPTVIDLDVPDEVLLRRLDTRGRADDRRDVIARRLALYRQETAPLVAYYRDRDYRRIDSERPPDEVFAAIEAAVQARARNVR